MGNRDIIVIGGSAGSIPVLQRICADLPADLPAAVLVVVHVGAGERHLLAPLIAAGSPLQATTAQDGEVVQHGRIYVAPSNHHLLLMGGTLRLGLGPRENLARPSVDPLFRSAAASCGARVIGVILSGMLNDGASGLVAVGQCGGLTVVQNPSDAAEPDMPNAALQACEVDYRAPAVELGAMLDRLCREEAQPSPPVPPDLQMEIEIALGGGLDSTRLRKLADPSTFSCPSCGGVLSELHRPAPLRFRCQIGHAYTAEVLDDELDRQTEEALAVALRIMETRATLVERMAEDARQARRGRSAADLESRAKEYRAHVETLRAALLRTR